MELLQGWERACGTGQRAAGIRGQRARAQRASSQGVRAESPTNPEPSWCKAPLGERCMCHGSKSPGGKMNKKMTPNLPVQTVLGISMLLPNTPASKTLLCSWWDRRAAAESGSTHCPALPGEREKGSKAAKTPKPRSRGLPEPWAPARGISSRPQGLGAAVIHTQLLMLASGQLTTSQSLLFYPSF